MVDLSFHQKLIEFLCWRRHIFIALSEWNDRKSHSLQILYHLGCAPSVKGNFPDMILLPQLLDKLLDKTIMDNIAFCSI